jgi:dihydrofolate reductase
MTYWETADTNPSAPAYELEFARIWKKMPKIVFSKTLEQVPGNARLVRGDVIEEVAKLKAQPGKDLGIGGGDRLQPPAARTDRCIRIFIHPVVWERNAIFPAVDKPINLRLVETRSVGVVYLHYQPQTRGRI